MKNKYKMGPVKFSVLSRRGDRVANAVRKEFEPLKQKNNEPVDIEYIFSEDIPKIENSIILGDIEVGKNKYRYRKHLVVHKKETKKVFVKSDINKNKKSKISKKIKKFRDWNYLSREQKRAKDFVYNVFDYTSVLELLRKKYCYIHASSFAKEGKGIAMVGWGGVGKTSTMLEMVLRHGWKYMSDDLGLISCDGILWRTPKKMQIYPYNIEENEKVRVALMKALPLLSRISWTLKRSINGPESVRRRVSAEELFGAQRAGVSAKLTDIFFLERGRFDEFEMSRLDDQTFAERAAIILLDELQPITYLSIGLCSSGSNILPTPSSIVSNCKSVIKSAIQDASIRLLKVPMYSTPTEISDLVRGEI